MTDNLYSTHGIKIYFQNCRSLTSIPRDLAPNCKRLHTEFNTKTTDKLPGAIVSYLNHRYRSCSLKIEPGTVLKASLESQMAFECDVHYQGTRIGTIQLLTLGNSKDKITLYHVTYVYPIKYLSTLQKYEYSREKQFLMGIFQRREIHYQFELGFKHPERDPTYYSERIFLDRKEHTGDFTYSFNAVVRGGLADPIQFVTLPMDRSETNHYVINNTSEIVASEAEFEDAVGSLLMLHLIVSGLLDNINLQEVTKPKELNSNSNNRDSWPTYIIWLSAGVGLLLMWLVKWKN